MDVLNWILVNAEPLATLLLGVLVAYATRFLQKKINNDYADGVVGRALAELQAAVVSVGQTYVSAIKDASADGTLTPEEKRLARDMAIAKAKENIGPEGLRKLARILGVDLDKWLETHLEKHVAENKEGIGTVPV